jgi:hypothetical protein
MNAVLDAFWRAVAYCLHPRVIALSVLPLVLVVGVISVLGYWYMDPALAAVQHLLESTEMMTQIWAWLETLGLGRLKMVVVPLLLIVIATPLIVLVCLLLVAMLMTPLMVRLVTRRRFPFLAHSGGASYVLSVFWALGASAVALLAMVVSFPLWFVPPLVLVIPPLIWGWLTYRVFAFDVLASHASAMERKTLLRQHRGSLLMMGVVSGYMGAAPSLLWASGAMAIPLAPVLVPAAIWIYTLVFAFASLWFAHYALAALAAMRGEPEVDVLEASPGRSDSDPLPRVTAVDVLPDAGAQDFPVKPPES